MIHAERRAWALMRQVFCNLFCPCGQEALPEVRWRIQFGFSSLQFDGDFSMVITDSQKVSAAISYQDARGNAARVDGVPAWATDRADLVALTPSEDGLSCEIAAVGALGTAQITVTADADLGEGVRTLTALGSIEVIGGEAVAGVISFGEPQPA